MSKFVRTIPVTIEFYYEPEELSTEEIFDLNKLMIGQENILELTNNSAWNKIEDAVYKYLKENKDDN